MKRDMDLVRKLLFHFEEKPDAGHMKVPPIEGYEESLIKYHCNLLYDAGLLNCEPVKSSTSDRVIYVLPFDLTWAGHEFLDKIRADTTWNRIKAQAKEKSLSLSFNIVTELAQRLAQATING